MLVLSEIYFVFFLGLESTSYCSSGIVKQGGALIAPEPGLDMYTVYLYMYSDGGDKYGLGFWRDYAGASFPPHENRARNHPL